MHSDEQDRLRPDEAEDQDSCVEVTLREDSENEAGGGYSGGDPFLNEQKAAGEQNYRQGSSSRTITFTAEDVDEIFATKSEEGNKSSDGAQAKFLEQFKNIAGSGTSGRDEARRPVGRPTFPNSEAPIGATAVATLKNSGGAAGQSGGEEDEQSTEVTDVVPIEYQLCEFCCKVESKSPSPTFSSRLVLIQTSQTDTGATGGGDSNYHTGGDEHQQENGQQEGQERFQVEEDTYTYTSAPFVDKCGGAGGRGGRQQDGEKHQGVGEQNSYHDSLGGYHVKDHDQILAKTRTKPATASTLLTATPGPNFAKTVCTFCEKPICLDCIRSFRCNHPLDCCFPSRRWTTNSYCDRCFIAERERRIRRHTTTMRTPATADSYMRSSVHVATGKHLRSPASSKERSSKERKSKERVARPAQPQSLQELETTTEVGVTAPANRV
ncbi:unnamed protein product [Amoebophrya sp. A120]|nr:unnamed protein product [Amoebophrya sp. A120]|eukprot:GSA120T00008209001.1